MGCVFCHQEEMYQHQDRKKVYHQGPAVTSLVCSRCIQTFLQLPQDKLIEAYHSAMVEGYLEKASWLESIIEEEDLSYVSETRETGPNIVRAKTVRLARPSLHQIGS